MSGMRRWLTSTALGFVLLSVLVLPPRVSAQNAPTSTCPPPCKPCGNGQTCTACDCKTCPHPPRQGSVTVCRRCCKSPGGAIHCSNFPKCPSVSK